MEHTRKNKIIAALAIILVITFLGNVMISFAATQSELEKERNETNQKIEDAKKKQTDIQNQMSTIKKEVEDLNTKISGYQDEIYDLSSQIEETEQKITEAEQEIEKTQKDLDSKQELLEKRLVASYKAGDTTYLDVLLSSDSLTSFLSNYYMIEELAEFDTKLIESVEQTKKDIEESKKVLEDSKTKLEETKKSQESKKAELDAAKSAKNSKVSELSAEDKELQKQIDELKNHEASVRNKIEQMKKEYDRQHSSGGNSGGSGSNSGSGTSSYGFGWPVSNHSIGTGYGVAGKYWSSGYHTGVDFPVGVGTPVYSIGEGQVFDTGYNSAYGNFVEIYHGNNIYSFYAHASSVNVSVGQKVTKGQKIMSSGKSGNVTGPHLHFEIRTPGYRYANCVNPMKYLP